MHVLKGKFASSVFHSCKAKNANDENSRNVLMSIFVH
jgi:hypothetical protein